MLVPPFCIGVSANGPHGLQGRLRLSCLSRNVGVDPEPVSKPPRPGEIDGRLTFLQRPFGFTQGLARPLGLTDPVLRVGQMDQRTAPLQPGSHAEKPVGRLRQRVDGISPALPEDGHTPQRFLRQESLVSGAILDGNGAALPGCLFGPGVQAGLSPGFADGRQALDP